MGRGMNLKIDLAKVLEVVGKVGGGTLVMGVAAVALAIAAMVFLTGNPVLLGLALLPVLVILPWSFVHFSRRATLDASKVKIGTLPPEIKRYLDSFPAFADTNDLAAGYVKTSPESFMYIAREIFKGLKSGSEINATDRLLLSRVNEEYWHSSGLAYLETNYNAAKRGIVINRCFIVSGAEIADHKEMLHRIIDLNVLCGIHVSVVLYESLSPNSRREFATFGDHYCDDVTYDIFGRTILENKVYFSKAKHAELSELVRGVSLLATPYPQKVEIAKSFEEVKEYARSVRQQLAGQVHELEVAAALPRIGDRTAKSS